MPSATTIRLQIEAQLGQKIPSALTPRSQMIRPVGATGITALDELLQGGLPVGALSELVGPECSGRTSAALSFVAHMTRAGKVCAWVDVSNTLDPAYAAAAGIDLARLLWVRCGVRQRHNRQTADGFRLPEKYFTPAPAKKGLHGGGFGPHPRIESHGLSEAVSGLLRPEAMVHRRAKTQRDTQQGERPTPQSFATDCPNSFGNVSFGNTEFSKGRPSGFSNAGRACGPVTYWSRMEQAMRATDLLLQGGGFSAIVLDLGSLAPEFASRIPLATWHRYRAAAERTQSSVVLLTQYACAKSSAELLLRFQPGNVLCDEATVFTGMEHNIEVVRQRFTQSDNVVPLRKPPQRANAASWQARTAWAGCR